MRRELRQRRGRAFVAHRQPRVADAREVLAGRVTGARPALVIEEHAQPDLGVDGSPEDLRRLHLTGAEAVERGREAGRVPVRPGTELRGTEQPLHRGAPGPQPPGLGGGEPDLPAPGAYLLGEHAPQAVAEDGPAPAAVDDRRRRQLQHPVDQLLVEERQARLHGERHRVPVLVPQQRRQREGLQVGHEPALEVVLRPLELRRLEPVVERGPEQRRDRQGAAAVGQAPLHQRLQHVARLPRLPRERAEAPAAQQLPQVHVLVGHVAGEQLVAALPVQQDRHLRLRQPHHAPLGVRPRRHDRLVLVPHEAVELVDEALGRGLRERGLGVDLGEHRVHVLALVDGVAVVDDREGLQPLAERHRVGYVLRQQPARHADDRRGVDPARQAGAGGDVGHQSPLHRALEAGAELGRIGRGVARQRRRPVRLFVHAVGVDHRPRRRGQGPDAGERGLRLVVVEAVQQVVVEPLPVGCGLELGIGQDRLGLRREQHPARARAGVVERLDPVVVACQHQPGRAPTSPSPSRRSRIASAHMPLKRAKQSVPHSR